MGGVRTFGWLGQERQGQSGGRTPVAGQTVWRVTDPRVSRIRAPKGVVSARGKRRVSRHMRGLIEHASTVQGQRAAVATRGARPVALRLVPLPQDRYVFVCC